MNKSLIYQARDQGQGKITKNNRSRVRLLRIEIDLVSVFRILSFWVNQDVKETKFLKGSEAVQEQDEFWVSGFLRKPRFWRVLRSFGNKSSQYLPLKAEPLRPWGSMGSSVWSETHCHHSSPPSQKFPNGRWTWSSEWQSLSSKRKEKSGTDVAWLDILGFTRSSLVVKGPLTWFQVPGILGLDRCCLAICVRLHLYLRVIANHYKTWTRFIYQWYSK